MVLFAGGPSKITPAGSISHGRPIHSHLAVCAWAQKCQAAAARGSTGARTPAGRNHAGPCRVHTGTVPGSHKPLSKPARFPADSTRPPCGPSPSPPEAPLSWGPSAVLLRPLVERLQLVVPVPPHALRIVLRMVLGILSCECPADVLRMSRRQSRGLSCGCPADVLRIVPAIPCVLGPGWTAGTSPNDTPRAALHSTAPTDGFPPRQVPTRMGRTQGS